MRERLTMERFCRMSDEALEKAARAPHWRPLTVGDFFLAGRGLQDAISRHADLLQQEPNAGNNRPD